jgi:2-polyprenyl-3-methyl-5-hydroxy-6-metoxy-1,4-benzoquinol methylase
MTDATPLPAEPTENSESIADAFARIDESGHFRVDDIALIAETYASVRNSPNTVWDHLRGKYLTLPDWFNTVFDPLSDEYFAQQMRLWKVIAGVDRPYSATVDESEEFVPDVDAVRSPGFYIWRQQDSVKAAADHVLASGMLMKHSGLEAGMWALEYGAGFGQTALAFARMGVNVDTVDISSTFCGYVKEQADFFRVNLTPFKAEFGDNPRGSQKYDLIWFYESFHHCVDFKNVVRQLKRHLTPGGKILLAGEPIVTREYAAVPYPWGLRLESEVIAVIRNLHWFELGYSEDFIGNFFVNNGYVAERFDCPVSAFGVTYSFSPRPKRIPMEKHWLPCVDAEGWHAPEQRGRWTRGKSSMALDQTDSFQELDVTVTNHHGRQRALNILYGGMTTTAYLEAGQQSTIRIDAKIKTQKITFDCEAIVTGGPDLESNDARALGIFVNSIDYLQ